MSRESILDPDIVRAANHRANEMINAFAQAGAARFAAAYAAAEAEMNQKKPSGLCLS